MSKYFDIQIKDDDLAVSGNQAVIITDLDVIAQDLIHAIRESGYLVEMIAERSDERQKLLLLKIELLAEDDERIVPGTVTITASPDNFTGGRGRWTLHALTYDFGDLALSLEETV
ncbi:MAG: DUF2590 family protein [Victivallaceae bacterium]|nr:DUF2590 family protein [Victivallaceae bacterium]